MSARLIVNQSNELQEFRETGYQPQSPAIRLVAKIISYIFHPIVCTGLYYLVPYYISTSPFCELSGRGKIYYHTSVHYHVQLLSVGDGFAGQGDWGLLIPSTLKHRRSGLFPISPAAFIISGCAMF